MRGHDGVHAVETETGLHLTLGGNYRDIEVTTNMIASEVERAVNTACLQLAND